jgi:hypothetical protein
MSTGEDIKAKMHAHDQELASLLGLDPSTTFSPGGLMPVDLNRHTVTFGSTDPGALNETTDSITWAKDSYPIAERTISDPATWSKVERIEYEWRSSFPK